MAYFPTSPTDGQSVTVGNVLYSYNSGKGVWKRSVVPLGNLTVTGNVNADSYYITSGVFWSANGQAFAGSLDSAIDANIGRLHLGNVTTNANLGTLFLGNASTQANIGAFYGYANANIGTLFLGNSSINSNLGAFQNYANANIGTLFLGNASTQANLGAFQTFSNANAATQATSINTINANLGTLFLGNASTQANLGAFQTFSNANAATQATSINTINANLGAYQLYANANIGTLFLGNASTQANLGAFQTYANANIGTFSANINALYTSNISTQANIGTLFLGNASTQANLGTLFLGNAATQANIGTLFLGNASTQANIGTLFLGNASTQANIGTIFLGNASTQANLGAFQSYANANIGTIVTNLNTLDANVGAFELYANTKIGNNPNSNLVVVSTTDSTSSTTGALVVAGGIGVGGNLYVAGNIFASNLLSINSTTLTVQDPLLYLNASSPFPYNYDIGFFSHFVGGSLTRYQHSGFARNVNDNTWTLFSNVFAEPGATITWSEANIIYDPIKVGSATIANTTISTSTTTGALIVAGGAGIAGALNIADTGDVSSNIGTLFLGNASTQANLGAFYTYANTTFTTLDANVGTLFLGNSSTNANLGAFQEYANANIGLASLNFDAFRAYANTKIGSNADGNLVTNGNVISNLYYSSGGTSRFALSDIGLVTIDVASQQYKFGASGIEASPGIFGGSYGGNKLSLNNETALISNRYDTVTIQTGTDGSAQNTWTFGNSALTAPGRITALGNIIANSGVSSTSNVTGALVVAGGVGVSGNIYANTIYTTTGIRWAGNGVAFSSGGGSGTPAGSDKQIQFNNGGVFGASSGLIYDDIHLKVYGNLETLYSSGDEGGEIILAKPQTNTTLAGNIIVDIYQNKLRIFENSGTNRGYYLDITSGGASVGTNIMSGGGGGSPAGSTGDIQFNNGGALGATTLVYNSATGNIVLTDTTDSTSTTTGALVVRGGIGVAGNVTADKLYTTAGLFWSGNGVAFSSGGGGSGTPGGSDTQIQYNSGGTTFAGSSGFTFNSTDGNVTVTSNVVAGNARITNNVFANKLFTTVGLFWAGNGVAFSSGTSGGGGGGGITYTSDTAPPLSPNIADQWYDTTTDVLYEYLEDGTSSYWVDVLSPMFSSGITNSVVGNVSITGPTSSIGHLTVARTTTVSGNIITLSNINVSKSANVLGNLTVGGNVAFSRDAAIAANLTVVGNVASGNVTTANISATGNITATGSITATGTISATTLSSANITVTSNVTTANVSATDISSTGNITSGNIGTNNLTASNIASGELTSSGNITAGNVTVSGNVTLTGANVYVGNVANLSIAGGASGQYLQTNGSGDLTWQTPPATNIQEFTATASQTTFTVFGTYTVGSVLVFVNGIQMNSADYTATDGSTVVLTEARNFGDTVRVVASFGAASLVSGLTLNVNNLQTFAVAMSIALGI